MKLRGFQTATLKASKERYEAGVRNQLIRWATGTGKSVLLSNLMAHHEIPGKLMVMVHREELIKQNSERMKLWNPTKRVGIEMADERCSPNDDYIVSSVATIGRAGSNRLLQFDPREFGCLIIDESHRSVAPSYQTVINHFRKGNPKILHVGMTATPNRGDGVGLASVYEEIVYDYPLIKAIRDGYLVDVKGFRVKTKVSLDQIHVVAGEFNQGELGRTVNTPERNDQIVKAWLEKCSDRQTVAFTVDIQHAQDLADAFTSRGVKAVAVWGADPDRSAKLAAHRARETQVLVNCQLLTEGYDDWQVSCVILARPIKSKSLYEQCVGRGTRIQSSIDNMHEARAAGKKLDKEDLYVLDVVDNSVRHSLNSVATLFGLSENLDLKGESILTVLEKVEDAELKGINLDKLTDFSELDTYIEQVDLFKVDYPKEITDISDYQWHHTSNGSYVLLLTGGDAVVVYQDLMGRWSTRGSVDNKQFSEFKSRDFESAIQEADATVRALGGRVVLSAAQRMAAWHNKPADATKLMLARVAGIAVPPGATMGEVQAALNKKAAMYL